MTNNYIQYDGNLYEAWDKLDSINSNMPKNSDSISFRDIEAEANKNHGKLSQDTVRTIARIAATKTAYGKKPAELIFQYCYNGWVYETAMQEASDDKLEFVDKNRDNFRIDKKADLSVAADADGSSIGVPNTTADFWLRSTNKLLSNHKTVEAKLYMGSSFSYGASSFHKADFVFIIHMTGSSPASICYKDANENYVKINLTADNIKSKAITSVATELAKCFNSSEQEAIDAANELIDLAINIFNKVSRTNLKTKLKRCVVDYNIAPMSLVSWTN